MKKWYYAKDRHKSGPVQKSHLIELYQKGEIAPGDLVWEEGMPAWVTAESVLGTLAVESALAANASTSASASLSADEKLHPFSCIERAWDLVWKHPAEIIGGTFLMMLLSAIVITPYQIGALMLNPQMAKILHLSPELHSLGWYLYGFGFIFHITLSPLLIAGLFWMLLQAVRGNQPSLGELFVAFKNPRLALKLIGVNLAIILVLCCIVISISFVTGIVERLPGEFAPDSVMATVAVLSIATTMAITIYILVTFALAPIVMVDQRTRVWQALAVSRRYIAGNWWRWFGLLLMLTLIIWLGLFACCVGTIITVPIATAGMVLAYENLKKLKGGE